MENETIIILCLFVVMLVVPILFVKLWHRQSRFTLFEHSASTTSPERETDMAVPKSEILNEMCKMQSGFMVTRLARSKGLSEAEINILKYKANPFYSEAFRVTEKASEDEINRWFRHPMIACPMPDPFVMSIAAQTPVPAKIMERILRKLLQDKYDSYWNMAEEGLKPKTTT